MIEVADNGAGGAVLGEQTMLRNQAGCICLSLVKLTLLISFPSNIYKDNNVIEKQATETVTAETTQSRFSITYSSLLWNAF